MFRQEFVERRVAKIFFEVGAVLQFLRVDLRNR